MWVSTVMKFKTKATIFTSLIIVIVTFFIGYIYSTLLKTYAINNSTQLLKEKNQNLADSINRLLHERIGNINLISKQHAIKQWRIDPDFAKKSLLQVRNSYGLYESISIIDESFKYQISSSNFNIGEYFEFPQILSEKRIKNDVIFVDFKDKTFKKVKIYFAKKIEDTNTFIVAAVPIERLNDIMKSFDDLSGALIKPYFELKNVNNETLFSSANFSLSKKNQNAVLTNDRLKSTNHDGQFLSIKTEIKSPNSFIENMWVLTLIVDLEDIYKPLFRLNFTVALLVLCFLLVLSLFLYPYLNETLKPLDDLASAMKKVNRDTLPVLIPVGNKNDEFHKMILGYNNMTENLMDTIQELNHKSKFAALGEMSAGLAHEINNPLAIIRGSSEILLKIKVTSDENIFHKNLNRINFMTERISKIILGLRTYARDGQKNERTEILANKLIDDLNVFCSEKFKNYGIDFQIDFLTDQLSIHGNFVRLSQVLLNLLNNAFDVVKNTDNPWIKIVIDTNDTHLIFKVINSGERISSDLAEKIFTPFFTTKNPGSGTGMGLSIAKSIVTEHDGQLFVNLKEPQTCFIFTVPKFKVPNTDISQEKKSA